LTKTAEAFRTISEVADELEVPKHVLRFWEGRFPQIRPMKRGGGRRYYRPEDLALLRGICRLLHAEGYTIKGVQKILREQGIDQVKQLGGEPAAPAPVEAPAKKSSRVERPRAVFATQGAAAVPAASANSRPVTRRTSRAQKCSRGKRMSPQEIRS
jgi:DNA-binding transcriptional MerR regulator